METVHMLDLPRVARLVLALLAASGVAACGWTPRDQYLRQSAVAFEAMAGDGSLTALRPSASAWWPGSGGPALAAR